MKNAIKKQRMISHEDFKRKLLKKKSFRKYYEDQSFEREIFKAIVRARAQKQFSQRELAAKIDVKQSALARFESGRTNPTLKFLKKVVSGLGLSVKVK